jgi:hypothetical protein
MGMTGFEGHLQAVSVKNVSRRLGPSGGTNETEGCKDYGVENIRSGACIAGRGMQRAGTGQQNTVREHGPA